MRRRGIVLAPLVVLGIVTFVGVGGWVVQLLWNWLLPPLWLARGHLLAGAGIADVVPDSLRRLCRSRIAAIPDPPADGGTVGADDAGGA